VLELRDTEDIDLSWDLNKKTKEQKVDSAQINQT